MKSSERRHFIFGYGSLISATSRAKTGETGSVWPVILSGYQRHWSVMTTEFGMSSVAVIQTEDAQCNGIIIEINENELSAFDEREQGYQRALIPVSQLQPYAEQCLPEGDVWIYYSQSTVNPTESCPIALSYLDVILAGCLELDFLVQSSLISGGESNDLVNNTFTKDFLNMTQGWQHVVLNDRKQPRYPRVQPELKTTHFTPLLVSTIGLPDHIFLESYDS